MNIYFSIVILAIFGTLQVYGDYYGKILETLQKQISELDRRQIDATDASSSFANSNYAPRTTQHKSANRINKKYWQIFKSHNPHNVLDDLFNSGEHIPALTFAYSAAARPKAFFNNESLTPMLRCAKYVAVQYRKSVPVERDRAKLFLFNKFKPIVYESGKVKPELRGPFNELLSNMTLHFLEFYRHEFLQYYVSVFRTTSMGQHVLGWDIKQFDADRYDRLAGWRGLPELNIPKQLEKHVKRKYNLPLQKDIKRLIYLCAMDILAEIDRPKGSGNFTFITYNRPDASMQKPETDLFWTVALNFDGSMHSIYPALVTEFKRKNQEVDYIVKIAGAILNSDSGLPYSGSTVDGAFKQPSRRIWAAGFLLESVSNDSYLTLRLGRRLMSNEKLFRLFVSLVVPKLNILQQGVLLSTRREFGLINSDPDLYREALNATVNFLTENYIDLRATWKQMAENSTELIHSIWFISLREILAATFLFKAEPEIFLHFGVYFSVALMYVQLHEKEEERREDAKKLQNNVAITKRNCVTDEHKKALNLLDQVSNLITDSYGIKSHHR